jgi:hypothetical protein
MVKVSSSLTVTVTTETDLFIVPADYVAYLTRLAVANTSGTTNTITIRYYNNDTANKVVYVMTLGNNETMILEGNELPEEGVPTKITVEGSQQPYTVSYTVDLR